MTFVPIRRVPTAPDLLDSQRVQLWKGRWQSQDVLLAQRDRQIEENIRMLAGRQWEVFSPQLGRFIDFTQFMDDRERAFRQRPVVNRLLFWFILTHARLTENPPIVGFQPSTADRCDAMLAEVMDPICKSLWHEIGMQEAIDRLAAWMIPSGSAYLKNRLDFSKGGEQILPKIGPGGVLTWESQREGMLDVDVLSALEVRGEWNAKPWHQKRWHMHRSFLTPDQVEERFGVRLKADATGFDMSGNAGYLGRLLFGAGQYGASSGILSSDPTGLDQLLVNKNPNDGLIVIDEGWELPDMNSPTHEPTPDNPLGTPGGRLTVIAPNQEKVLWDSERPYRLRAASPIHKFGFVGLPGRPDDTTPQEMLNPIQRAYNRGLHQILEHRALLTHPLIEIDADSGLEPDDVVLQPGAKISTRKRPGVDAFRFVAPPQLSNDVWKTQAMLADSLDMLGNVHGGMGTPPTADASGELVVQLRYNSDRFIGPTARRLAQEMARVVEDWPRMLAVAWTTERIIAYAGEDNLPRTVTVLPEMFMGTVNVIADPESAMPESRSERQKRVIELYQLGAYGVPGSPDAVAKFLEQARFPHMSRALRPGGVHRITAEHILGKILQGEPAGAQPLYPWYDYDTHRAVFEEYMSSPDYLKLQLPVRAQLEMRRQAILVMQQAVLAQHAQEAIAQASAQGAVAGAGQAAAQNMLPPPPADPNESSEPNESQAA